MSEGSRYRLLPGATGVAIDDRTDPHAADPLVGRLIADRYEVEEWIARGGMSRVYRARDKQADRLVALKVLRAPRGEPIDLYARWFSDEATTGAALRHANTVQIFDWGQTTDGIWYLAMEYVRGNTLAHVIRTEGALAPTRAIRIASSVASSLREAHARGIVHRDVKPANVMLVMNGDREVVKVLDFGIAGDIDEPASPEGAPALGSPRYVAPEQIKHVPVDDRADIYSFGIVLYEMLSGAPPFTNNRAVAVLLAHLHEMPRSIVDVSPNPIGNHLTRLVGACLEKDPNNRPKDMDAVLRALWESSLELGEPVLEARSGIHPAGPTIAQKGWFEQVPLWLLLGGPLLCFGFAIIWLMANA